MPYQSFLLQLPIARNRGEFMEQELGRLIFNDIWWLNLKSLPPTKLSIDVMSTFEFTAPFRVAEKLCLLYGRRVFDMARLYNVINNIHFPWHLRWDKRLPSVNARLNVGITWCLPILNIDKKKYFYLQFRILYSMHRSLVLRPLGIGILSNLG